MADRTKITTARARAFMPADGREAVLWDSLAPGFGLRVRPNGRKTWIVHRRRAGAVVRKTLGALDALSVENARQAGRALLAEAKAGTVPTMRRFAPSFLADCAERWKPATRATYAHIVRRWILPTFGGRRVDAIGTTEVRRWFDGIAATHPGSANRPSANCIGSGYSGDVAAAGRGPGTDTVSKNYGHVRWRCEIRRGNAVEAVGSRRSAPGGPSHPGAVPHSMREHVCTAGPRYRCTTGTSRHRLRGVEDFTVNG